MTSYTTFLFAFTNILLFSIVSADKPLVIFGRECPDVTGSLNFNQNSYLGKWYNVANSPFFWMDSENTCPWAVYSKGTEYDIDVTNSEYHVDDQQRGYANGHAMINQNLPGTLSVSFSPVSGPSADGDNYIILDTDNDYFSYVWSCSDACVFTKCLHRPVLWVLNKNGDLSETVRQEEVNSALKILEDKFGYDTQVLRSKMMLSSQEHCD